MDKEGSQQAPEKEAPKQFEQKYEHVLKPNSWKKIISNNFLGGIAWALGATVGVSIIFTLLGIISANVNFSLIPYIGKFINDLINFVMATNPNLNK